MWTAKHYYSHFTIVKMKLAMSQRYRCEYLVAYLNPREYHK